MHRVETTLQMARPSSATPVALSAVASGVSTRSVVFPSRSCCDPGVHPTCRRRKWLAGCVLEIGSGQETYTRDEFLAQSPTMTFWRSEISTGGYGRQASVSAGFYALLCDVTCMSFRDKSLDGVICSEVLEHVPNYQAALDEFARVLRPGGKLLITSPFVFPLHGPPDFWRFTPEAFQLLLREQFTILNLELAP